MKRLFTAVILSVTLITFNDSIAQQTGRHWSQLSKEEQKEIIRERIGEVKKEKMRLPEKNSTKNSQWKSTAADKQLTIGGDEESEVSLAVHPLDSNKLVLSYMSKSMTVPLEFPVHYSNNGGQTWAISTFSPLNELMNEFPNKFPIGGGDPVFAWDKNGRVYMSWLYLIADMNLDTAVAYTFWAYSDDDGKNWSMEPGEDHVISKGAMDPMTQQMIGYEGMADRQWFAVDNSGGPNQGNLYCSYFFIPGDEDPNKVGTCVKVKKPDSTFFGASVLVYNGSTQFGNVETDKTGKVHVTFADLAAGEVRHASSANGGQTFSSSHLIGSGQDLFGGSGIVHDRENSATNLAIDKDGNLHVVWGDFTSTTCKAYYSRSINGGNTWDPAVSLNKNSYKHVLMAAVAADKDVSISYTGIDNNDSAYYYQINSTDNGSSFGAPVKLSEQPTYYKQYTSGEFFGDYNRSVRSGCMDYSGWADGRGTVGARVYFARTNQCTLGIKDVTAVNNGISLIKLYPNPAKDNVHLTIRSARAEKIMLTITDMSGRKLYSHEHQLPAGEKEILVPVGNMPRGAVILSVNSDEGLAFSRNFILQ